MEVIWARWGRTGQDYAELDSSQSKGLMGTKGRGGWAGKEMLQSQHHLAPLTLLPQPEHKVLAGIP